MLLNADFFKFNNYNGFCNLFVCLICEIVIYCKLRFVFPFDYFRIIQCMTCWLSINIRLFKYLACFSRRVSIAIFILCFLMFCSIYLRVLLLRFEHMTSNFDYVFISVLFYSILFYSQIRLIFRVEFLGRYILGSNIIVRIIGVFNLLSAVNNPNVVLL